MLAEHAVLGFGRGSHSTKLVLGLALSGLAIHAFLDGIALTEEAYAAVHAGHGHDTDRLGMLSAGVLLHRLPVGLALWSIVRPGRGAGLAFGLLAMISVFTVVGHNLGPESVQAMPMGIFGIFQALVAGSLVHVVLHRPSMIQSGDREGLNVSASMGALVALGLLIHMVLDGLDCVWMNHAATR